MNYEEVKEQKTEVSEERLARLQKKGLKHLSEQGIDPFKYKDKVEMMKEIDLSFGQAVQGLDYVKEGLFSVEEVIGLWKKIYDKYQEIDVKKPEGEMQEMVKLMKVLVNKCQNLLEKNKEKQSPDFLEKLDDVSKKMKTLSERFSNIPAYASYRKYWIYEEPEDGEEMSWRV